MIKMKLVPKDPIDNTTVLRQLMAWPVFCATPLPHIHLTKIYYLEILKHHCIYRTKDYYQNILNLQAKQ